MRGQHRPRAACALFWASAVLCAALGWTAPAHAQNQNEAAARSLFVEGRALAGAGKYEQACAKFEAAEKLYKSSGLLLNLADCHEHLNRTATAWAEFGDAAFAAASAGRSKDESEAKRRQSALESKLSRISVHVASPVPGEVVHDNGSPIDRAAWDTAIPVDPGTHTMTADAAGHTSWTLNIEIRDPGKTITIEVTVLPENKQAAVAVAPLVPSVHVRGPVTPPPLVPDHAQEPGQTMRIAGIVTAGAGVVGVGVGVVLGVVAKSQFDSANEDTSPSRVSASAAAGRLADVSTVVCIVGGAAAVTGAVLWFAAPKAPVVVGTNGREFLLAGKF
jgi:hypothetical protein